MKVRLINDWKHLFFKHAIGGRFAAFTFFNIAYMHTGEKLIDGFTIVLLGLGLTIKRS